MKKIGERIKSIRKLLNKSQEQFAHDLSISKQAVSNIETAKSLPSITILCKLLIDFNVNINYILSGVGEMFISKDNSLSTLKTSIITEVEKYLESRGIV